MARWSAPTPTISINDFRNGQGSGYNNINTIRNDSYPGLPSVSNWRDLAVYRGQFHYRFTANMNVSSGFGFINMSYPYSISNTASFTTYWIAQGPYNYATISAGNIYGSGFTFQYWNIPGYGLWSYAATINLYHYDPCPATYNTITAIYA